MSDSSARSRLPAATTPPHLITLVILAGAAAMTMNIFLPVLPDIARDFNVSDATAQLVLTLFLATTGVMQLVIGPLSDRYGRRPVLMGAVAVFTVASVICLAAPTIEWLLAGRVLQASSAACIALSRAIVRDLYEREKAASMIGYITMSMAVIPMVAPTIGGLVGEYFGWRATFFVLLAAGIAMLVLIWLDLGETHTPSGAKFTRQVRDYGQLLKEPDIWGYSMTAALGAGVYFTFLAGAPFVGGVLAGLTPSQLGLFFALVALGYMFGNFLTARFAQRLGVEPMMLYGSIVCAIGALTVMVLMNLFETRAIFLFGPMMLVGMGNGLMLPNANAGAVSVRPELAGSASGLAGALQIGGGAALAALAGALISVENQALPLYFVMVASSLGGLAFAFWMWRRSRTG